MIILLIWILTRKCGCKTVAELNARVGEAQSRYKRRALMSSLFDTYSLTQREREICELLLTTGIAQNQIAERVGLSGYTVNYHIKNIYRKLSIQSRAELTAMFAKPEDAAVG